MSILMTILPSPSLLNKIKWFILARKEEKFSLNYGLFLLGWKSGLRVNEAISFDYHLKHPRHKNLYLVHGKGNKTRYVYVSREIIQELKSNHWKPNQTNRFAFNNFLKRVKEKMNIPANVELTPHTFRRAFTTHNALNGVPIPILQKVLGHRNIKTTSCYWKGSVDIREFGEWLEPDSSPEEPEEIPKVKVSNNPQLPKAPQIPPKLENPNLNNAQEPELLKTIEKLKGELAEKDKQLKDRDSVISLLTSKNKKLKTINQNKDQQLAKYKERLKELTEENNSLLQNYSNLKNTAENPSKNLIKNNQKIEKPMQLEISPKTKTFLLTKSPNTLFKIKERQNKPLASEEKNQAELVAEIQVWKPPN